MSIYSSDFVWSTALTVCLFFGLLPGVAVRLLVLAYPKAHPRRAELVRELYEHPWHERPLFAAQAVELAIFEGLAERVAARHARTPKEVSPGVASELSDFVRSESRELAAVWGASSWTARGCLVLLGINLWAATLLVLFAFSPLVLLLGVALIVVGRSETRKIFGLFVIFLFVYPLVVLASFPRREASRAVVGDGSVGMGGSGRIAPSKTACTEVSSIGASAELLESQPLTRAATANIAVWSGDRTFE